MRLMAKDGICFFMRGYALIYSSVSVERNHNALFGPRKALVFFGLLIKRLCLRPNNCTLWTATRSKIIAKEDCIVGCIKDLLKKKRGVRMLRKRKLIRCDLAERRVLYRTI